MHGEMTGLERLLTTMIRADMMMASFELSSEMFHPYTVWVDANVTLDMNSWKMHEGIFWYEIRSYRDPDMHYFISANDMSLPIPEQVIDSNLLIIETTETE